MLVKEGNCSYPKKAIKAQSLGADGIIIGSKDT
jgi:putative N-acetylmannosamine-6-phosphate epimerase